MTWRHLFRSVIICLYDHDFSLVYPVARVLLCLVVLWSFLFYRRYERWRLIGILIIICGLVIIGATNFFPHTWQTQFQA